jgi:hypothetical protein
MRWIRHNFLLLPLPLLLLLLLLRLASDWSYTLIRRGSYTIRAGTATLFPGILLRLQLFLKAYRSPQRRIGVARGIHQRIGSCGLYRNSSRTDIQRASERGRSSSPRQQEEDVKHRIRKFAQFLESSWEGNVGASSLTKMLPSAPPSLSLSLSF